MSEFNNSFTGSPIGRNFSQLGFKYIDNKYSEENVSLLTTSFSITNTSTLSCNNNEKATIYLTRLQEIKNWVSVFLQDNDVKNEDIFMFEKSLQNGVILAEIGYMVAPDIIDINKIYDPNQLNYRKNGVDFRHMDNINYFKNAIKSIKFPSSLLPDSVDIYNGKCVVTTLFLHILGTFLYNLGLAPAIKDHTGFMVINDDEKLRELDERLESFNIPTYLEIGSFLKVNCSPSTLKIMADKEGSYITKNYGRRKNKLIEKLEKELTEGQDIFYTLYQIGEENNMYVYEALYDIYEDLLIRETLKEDYSLSLNKVLTAIQKGTLCGDLCLSAMEGNCNVVYDVLEEFEEFSKILNSKNKSLYFCSINDYIKNNGFILLPQEIENHIIEMNNLSLNKKASEKYLRRWMINYTCNASFC